jgi:hypothetical protein
MPLKIHPENHSFQNASKKIAILAQNGYQLVGNLPNVEKPWAFLRMGLFLFVKENELYCYKAGNLLSDLFLESQVAVLGDSFYKLVSGDYIYAISVTKIDSGSVSSEHLVVLLRKNASLSGHHTLKGPCQTDETIGGEVYYEQGKLLLINHKSGSFASTEEKALPFIKKVWGDNGVSCFHAAVIKEEVDVEIQKRLSILKAKAMPENSASSSKNGLFAVVPPSQSLSDANKVTHCLSCTIF